MPGRPRRTFTLRDAIVLVAATALGFAWLRACWSWESIASWRWIGWAVFVLRPLLATSTVAIVALRLLAPRPPLRRLVLQPGASACGAVAFVLAMESLHYAGLEISRNKGITPDMLTSGSTWFEVYDYALVDGPYHHVLAVVWGLLMLARRCRPEPSWIDRAGRALGVAWIVLALLSWAEALVMEWGTAGFR